MWHHSHNIISFYQSHAYDGQRKLTFCHVFFKCLPRVFHECSTKHEVAQLKASAKDEEDFRFHYFSALNKVCVCLYVRACVCLRTEMYAQKARVSIEICTEGTHTKLIQEGTQSQTQSYFIDTQTRHLLHAHHTLAGWSDDDAGRQLPRGGASDA